MSVFGIKAGDYSKAAVDARAKWPWGVGSVKVVFVYNLHESDCEGEYEPTGGIVMLGVYADDASAQAAINADARMRDCELGEYNHILTDHGCTAEKNVALLDGVPQHHYVVVDAPVGQDVYEHVYFGDSV